MPTKRLPARPDLGHLKHQAYDLSKDVRAGKSAAYQRLREFHPRFTGSADPVMASSKFTLADAYLTVAREYGFPSWARLSRHVGNPDHDPLDRPHHERIQDVVFRRAVDLLDDGDLHSLRDHLARHPDVVHQRIVFDGGNYFRDPTLLEFVAENPVRHDSLPPNIVEVARVILDAGARTDQHAIDMTLRSCVQAACHANVKLANFAMEPTACTCRGAPRLIASVGRLGRRRCRSKTIAP